MQNIDFMLNHHAQNKDVIGGGMGGAAPLFSAKAVNIINTCTFILGAEYTIQSQNSKLRSL